MAFPVIQGTAETAIVASSSHVINLPTGIVSGELLLILANAGTVVISFNALAGWTELLDEGIANGMVVWARQADGTEGATVTFTSTAAGRSASIAYRISSTELLATQAPQLSTVATGSSVSPNATTCTPTGGAKDYLWISFFGRDGEEADDDTWTTAAPASYTGLLQVACGIAGTNQGGMVAAAQRSLNAASEDAGAFTCATGGWRAYTIAVHPSSAAALPIPDLLMAPYVQDRP
jgi:hypothetical protein